MHEKHEFVKVSRQEVKNLVELYKECYSNWIIPGVETFLQGLNTVIL